MNKFTDWLYNYTYNNWKFTPKSKGVLYGAAGILTAGIITAFVISKKK